MLLSHTHRFIYTKTIKTAGTSVEIFLENACVPSGSSTPQAHHIEQTLTSAGVIGYRGPNPSGRTWYNHMPAKEIRDLVGQTTWGAYYKFCIVRNPFDKLVSLWWFINSKRATPYQPDDFSQIKSDFSSWCIGHASNAVDRDKYLIEGRVSMDCFIRYERLLDDLANVCQHVGYPFQAELLGRFKGDARVNRQPFLDYYDPPAIAAVEAAFAWELDYFGYNVMSRS